MSIQERLRETEELSSLRVLPLLGLEGLSFASRKDLTQELQARMRERLETFKKGFCDPVLKANKVLRTHHGPGSRSGFSRLCEDEILLASRGITPEELRRIVRNASRAAQSVLQGRKVSQRTLELRMNDLKKFLDLAKEFCEGHPVSVCFGDGVWYRCGAL